MDHNEISMFMDAKIDLQDKRSIVFSQWTRCQVKIEAVKCLPCFLRITLEPREECSAASNFTILINVPGVSITLASSRTKQYSYAVSWLQNRKNCYIYFALDTELSCRRHMKWIRKSIKNLELHRKLMLEERRNSGFVMSSGLGPLPLLPSDFNSTDDRWSKRVSEIYEEIFDESSRQESQRESITSGIYEEMKPPFNSSNTFERINEELFAIPSTPPPLPPLPPQRKRFNTYETEETGISCQSVEIPRSNTNPETDMAKKKKYRNVLENLFYGNALRSKRTVSVSDDGSKEEIAHDVALKPKAKQFIQGDLSCIINDLNQPTSSNASHIYANDDVMSSKRQKKPFENEDPLNKNCSKRNSFSSPDLSKINFLDTFDEQRVAELLSNSYSKCEELDLAICTNLDETEIMPKGNFITRPLTAAAKNTRKEKYFEDNNISQRIPNNFNFSACNNSAINLIAPLSSQFSKNVLKNKIIFDDLSGYCVMAPIVKKMSAIDNTPLPSKLNHVVLRPLESISSGYSSSSHCSSSSSSCTNSAEEPIPSKLEKAQPSVIQEESVVYENMNGAEDTTTAHMLITEFTGNLYENLLTVKAAQELEQQPAINSSKFSTSTPTESPSLEQTNAGTNVVTAPEDENYYQTPRKSIISIDEKVPSYYPNTCESSVRSRRRSYSPARVNTKNLTDQLTPSFNSAKCANNTTTTTPNLKHIKSARMRYERKENIFITSPQSFIEQTTRKMKNNTSISPIINIVSKSGLKTKKTAAHKISENVYAVTHCLKKTAGGPPSICNNNVGIKHDIGTKDQKQLQSELMHLAVLQNIDFKFEDPNIKETGQLDAQTGKTTPITPQNTISSSEQHEKLSKNQTVKCNQSPIANNMVMTQSSTVTTNQENVGTTEGQLTAGIKKFASLPRFKRFNLSPLRTRINNVLQRHQTPDL